MTSGHPLMLSFGGTGIPTVPGMSVTPMPIPPAICQFNPFLCPPSSGSSGFTAAQLGDFVRQASNHSGPFPKVSIWHGSADTTVNPINAKEETLQWTNVHGISSTPALQDAIKGVPHQAFKDASGNVVVETFTITGMSHGVPIDPGVGADQCGTADQFVIDANICSSFFIAKFWGLVP
jgi:poly(3-hydroxybutyrate) depolymerase